MEKQYIGFNMSGQEYAVDLLSVREVIRNVSLTRNPDDPRIAGMIRLRGHDIPVVDMHEKLGLPATEGEGNVMVLDVEGQVAGLQVGEITGVIPIAEEASMEAGDVSESGSEIRAEVPYRSNLPENRNAHVHNVPD